MSPRVPALLRALIDDAAVFPPGSAVLSDAIAGHRLHRAAWYADAIGPLAVPASELDRVAELAAAEPPAGDGPAGDGPADGPLGVAVIGDAGIAPLYDVAARYGGGSAAVDIRQVEVAVAKRMEDPLPGLAALADLPRRLPGVDVYAEIPLTWGLSAALDVVVREREAGSRLAPKFRTGGLAAELFPTPIELGAVICACRDRDLPFKLTAGLHHAIRRTDPETGLTHHGFLNVLVAATAAAEGGEPADLAEILAGTDPQPLVEATRARLHHERPLWIAFGCCAVTDPLADLRTLAVLS